MKKTKVMFLALGVFLLAMSGVSYGMHQYGKGQVNVNTATKDQLVWFLGQTGIGDASMIADNILAYRTANGPFGELTDLMKVKGIDETVLDKIRYRVKVSGDTDYDPEAENPAPDQMKTQPNSPY
jgi:competence ComEA-like helix-hairpin-helix protein